MKEIGGYLGLEKLICNPYHKNAINLNSARSALLYLIKNKKIKCLYLPFYLCDSVFNYIKNESVEIVFYHINKDFLPEMGKLKPNSTIYIVNYFGVLNNNLILYLKNKYDNIIIDNTHNFFLEPLENIDTIYSCRKFFGVPDGAYLYTDILTNQILNTNKVTDRLMHIIGRNEYSASDFYQDYIKNDNSFDYQEISLMSTFSTTILGAIDYDFIKNKRNENFFHLNDNLNEDNLLEKKLLDSISTGQFCYPLLLEKPEPIRKKLINHKIYIPILWPNVVADYGANITESKLAYNILPIPCDQRYDKSDMDTIINIIKDENYI